MKTFLSLQKTICSYMQDIYTGTIVYQLLVYQEILI